MPRPDAPRHDQSDDAWHEAEVTASAEDEDDTDTAAASGRNGAPQERVRIDKWLWAARFYRTRSLAKEAIEGGKVHCDGQRVKVSKEVKVGMLLEVRQGFDEKTVRVKALSEVRGPASVAQQLYEETPESLAAREQLQANRRAQNLAHPDQRPSKKDRRQIHRFKDSWDK
jgi:ribosome-associated heat shock protein Hsp15